MKRNSAKPVQLPTDTGLLGYLAGIVDGEGTVGMSKSFVKGKSRSWSHFVHVIVVNTNPMLIDWLRQLGGSVKRRKKAQEFHKQSWAWQLFGDNAYQLLTAIRPYLIVKQQQADLAIAFHNLKQTRRAGRPMGGPLTADEVDLYETMRQDMLKANGDTHRRRFKIVA